ncbi:MAG: class I SAM-dependent methyltransferase [Pseudonocardia sp.]|nr:class I SAM-dependent methyltransferase [Pseudonocardia sp.]
MPFEHPQAYLVGIAGLALLRAWAGEHGEDFVRARLDEARQVLAEDELDRTAVHVDSVDTVTGYRRWAETYDDPSNAAFGLEEPAVRAILDGLTPGVALDAACGTGRHAEHLAATGHHVIGIDSSPEMLDHARRKVPSADLRLGTLEQLPLDDASVDLAVCALAFAHLPDPGPAIAELARVLRPGGHLVISDVHHEAVLRGSVPPVLIDGRPARLRNHRHYPAEFVRPALAHGLRVLDCQEPRLSPPPPQPAAEDPGPWTAWPWSLAAMLPAAVAAANENVPGVIVWHFDKPA